MTSALRKSLAPVASGFDFVARASAAIARRLRPRPSASGYSSSVRFAVLFDGSVTGLYQLKLWLPIFEKVGEPFDVLVRNGDLVAPISKLTKAKVHLLKHFEQVPNNRELKLLFYVN
ncbi:MAG: hypothetical protein RLZZ06_925, partial [Actinomycetota bacterium]